ncbi:hypothetical protein HN51_064232 [Arachis hypogaea]|uniref:uncharacterized protein LOC107620409 n=1 Tax=Arachis ipaensis TaxID=130454 RepID=UPI0007AEE89A|nr:uncharacterized protein LOC107620409 [Arachis ipaensis]XP_025628905.2 uncharacterized protein LOC112722150 [Arachis hypogaea]QHO21842.1 uncharacterized protein DS421_11g350160 [Arachis hypogaea]
MRAEWVLCPLKMVWESIKTIGCNKVVFATIMAATSVPLSALTLYEARTTHDLAAHIHRLESLGRHVHTRLEARHVFEESRQNALSLLRLKLLFSFPSYLLSLFASLFAVHSSLLPSPTLRSAAIASFHSFHRPLLTSIVVYALLFLFSPFPHFLAALVAPSPALSFIVPAMASFLQIYLMAVLSLGLVVSVAEERFGWDAIRIGHGIMAGRRLCAWLLSGMFVAVSGLIRWKVDAVAAEGETGIKEKAIVIVSYAFVVIWSYAIMTAFYSHCRKRHPIKESLPDHNPDQHLQLVSL